MLKKAKNRSRVISFVMALLMALTLLPMGLLSGALEVKAASTVYKFDATELTATADKEALAAGTMLADSYYKVFGTVTMRTQSDGSVKSVEIGKNGTGGFEFTVTGTATVKVSASSTGGSNTSTIGLVDADGNPVANKEGLTEVSTTTAATLTYELEAGTYQLVSPQSDYNRGARVYSIESEEVSATTITNYTFAASDLTATADKEAVAAGTTVADDYLKVFGSVTMRTQSDGSVKSVEIGKNGTGGFEFTVTGTATVKVSTSSTGGSNTSTIGLVDADGNPVANKEGLTEVSTTTAATLTYELEAGTYQLVSPQSDYNRGARVYSIDVEEVVSASVTTEYTFAASDLTATADKEAVAAGTTVADDFMKIFGSVTMRTQSDGSVKSVEIGKNGTGGFEFTITGTATVVVSASSTGGSNTSTIGLVDADGNPVANAEGLTEVSTTTAATLTYELSAGTYQLVSPQSDYNRGARVYSINITETTGGARPARMAWDKVAAPVITSTVVEEGDITVAFNMVIGYDGADSVKVQMLKGTEVVAEKSYADTSTSGSLVFTPDASGEYTFKAIATRAEETDKESAASEAVDFVLPLVAPAIESATSNGGGKINVVWSAVDEATGYNVYCNGELAGTTTTATEYEVTGLTVGTKYAFTVTAVRGAEESAASAAAEATATQDAQRVWANSVYGPSTGASNGFEGNLNDDGKVTVYSEGGKGKLQNTYDGVSFYYTAIPTNLNFTLRAKVTVDSWTISNGQDGFGIMVTDRLGKNGDSSNQGNNAYMALASKIEYVSESTGAKYSMKLGLGVLEKVGLTKDNIAEMDGGKLPEGYTYEYKTLDKTPDKQGLAAGTYNIIGNATAEAPGTIAEYTEFILEIQRNNTGYFVTYYDADGETILTQEKYYDTEALDKLDEEFVYAGFFASRNARATFSDVVLTTIAPEDDAPAEERPVEKIVPTLNIRSADIANSDTYLLSLIANVDGTVTIKLGGKVVAADLVAKADVKLDQEIALTGDKNELVIEFTPDPDQDLGEYTVLASTDKVTVNKTVTVNNKFEKYNNIYVGPNGKSTAKGTRKDPIDIYTAVACVKPGQTIVILEGTYLLDKTVRIERGMNGTEDSKIRMVADPEAKTRPVFDFQEKCPGIVHGGDYWYFNGFDVTNSEDRQKGFQVSGDNNVLDNIVAYHNGNTGIQLSRLYGTDLFEDWPANNLVLNCTSYGNEDTGYEDADGFAAKLTVGEGNVFDGCVAYNNADDGWDLYAKPETGPIGSVTIQNCVAYANGYMEDGRNAGNGNGFKMGGDGITGKHVLKNSYAFFNKAKGIDSNSCPDILVYNSISYNNESYNVAFYTKNNANTDFFADGIISFKDATVKNGLTTGDNLEPLGTQDSTKYLGATNYYWDGSKSANAGDAEATAEWFKSLTFTGVTRNEDNTINMNGFLELTALAPAGVGAVPAGTASTVVVLEIDQYGDFSNAYMAWLVLIGAAFVTAGFFAKKKFA